MARAMVVGVGNVLTGDDALGPTVVRCLEARWELGEDVEALDAGTPGMDLAALIGDAEVLVVVDTVSADAPAGTLRVYDREQLLARPLTPRVNPHAPGLAETLFSLDLEGSGPRDVRLVGVVPAAVEVGVGMSAAVREAVGPAEAAVVASLDAMGFPLEPRDRPFEPDLWWERSASAGLATAHVTGPPVRRA